jgi:hypothetical protein
MGDHGGEPMNTVQWVESYEEGLKKAAAEKKPLFLDFFKKG